MPKNSKGAAKTAPFAPVLPGLRRDFDSTIEVRFQFLARLGVPLHRAGLIAGLALGEARP